jgi:hypothetical protein
MGRELRQKLHKLHGQAFQPVLSRMTGFQPKQPLTRDGLIESIGESSG